jgi:hypothetical protein
VHPTTVFREGDYAPGFPMAKPPNNHDWPGKTHVAVPGKAIIVSRRLQAAS